MILISTFKENNVIWGITISGLVTFISYVIISFATDFSFGGFYLDNDIQFVLGTILGVILTLKNRQPHQAFVKYGVVVGVLGGILSSSLITLFLIVLFSLNIVLVSIYFVKLVISVIAIGLIGGALIGMYFTYKEVKGESNEEETLDDDFFDDIIKTK